jgi:hypothetical protein
LVSRLCRSGELIYRAIVWIMVVASRGSQRSYEELASLVEINAEAGRCVQEAFVPPVHHPAAEARSRFH